MRPIEPDDGTKLEALAKKFEKKSIALVSLYHLAKRTIFFRTLRNALTELTSEERAKLREEYEERSKNILGGYNKLLEEAMEEYQEEASYLYLK